MISHHWLGEISGYQWQVEGNRVFIHTGIGDSHMEADLSSDCLYMEDGRYYYDDCTLDPESSCWTAEKG